MPDHLPSDDDDLELELEPVDPDILAHERERGKKKTDHAQRAVNEDLIRQAEELDDPISLEELKKFRFTTRHLMMLTALLALMMTALQQWGFGLGLFITAMSAVGAGWLFTMLRERRQQEAVNQLRDELANNLQQENQAASPVKGNRSKTGDDRSEQIETSRGQAELSFSFSLKEILITFVVAAVLLGLVSLLGAGPLSILLGMIALGGLVAQAVGVEAPPIGVFGWWILLVLYLLLGLWSATTA